MIKKFCDKCGVELKSSFDYKVEGKIEFNRNRYTISIEMELGNDQHICRGCQIDAIKALDCRPDPAQRPDDLMTDELEKISNEVIDKIEGCQPKKTPPIYAPKKRAPVKP